MRTPNDFYRTHPRFVEDLLPHIRIYGKVLECCAGENDITNVLRKFDYDVLTNDKYKDYGHNYHFDATNERLYEIAKDNYVEWIISNPPYNEAIKILETIFSFKNRFKVAMHLRLSFVEPTLDREKFLTEHPRTGEIVLPRYSYKRNGKTDSVTSAWFLWNTEVIKGFTAHRLD